MFRSCVRSSTAAHTSKGAGRVVNRTISRMDIMFRAMPNEEGYFRAGETAARAVLAATIAAGASPADILDYGCGHGRVSRWLRHNWPEAKFCFADIRKNEIEFCASEFAGEAFLIDRHFSKVDLPRSFDLIWLGSVFTHMDRDAWRDLLENLRRHLNPNGLICFSFAGRTVFNLLDSGDYWGIEPAQHDDARRMVENYRRTGFGFLEQSRSDLGIWGRSIARMDWVMDFCHQAGGRIRFFSESAYAERQDVIAISFPKQAAGAPRAEGAEFKRNVPA